MKNSPNHQVSQSMAEIYSEQCAHSILSSVPNSNVFSSLLSFINNSKQKPNTEFSTTLFQNLLANQTPSRSLVSTQSDQQKTQIFEEEQDVELNHMILKVYSEVPSQYFSKEFKFERDKLSQSRESVERWIEIMAEQLDQVEVALFYLINNKFSFFQLMVKNIIEINHSIEKNKIKLRKVKNQNLNVKVNLIVAAKQIIKKKNDIRNLDQTLQTIKLIKTTFKSIIATQDLVDKNQYILASRLLIPSEQQLQQFIQIKCYDSIQNKVKNLKAQIQQGLTNQYISKCFTLLNQNIEQFKNNKSLFTPISMDESVILNESIIIQDASSVSNNRDLDLEEELRNMTQQITQLVDLSSNQIRSRFMEQAQNWCQSYLTEWKQFSNVQELEQLENRITKDMYIKVISHYNNNMINLIQNTSIICIITISAIEQITTTQLDDIIDSYMSLLVQIFKYTQSIILSILFKSVIHQFSNKQFLTLQQIFSSWIQLQIHLSQVFDYNGKLKHYAQRLSINQIQLFQQEVQINYLHQLKSIKHDFLRKQMENESWNNTDIGFEFHQVFANLLGLHNPTLNLEESVLEPISSVVQNGVFKILKNEVVRIIDGYKYKPTRSCLALIQIMDEFMIIIKTLTDPTQGLKMMGDIIKFYNSYSIQLILGAGAVAFENIKTITARIIAISSNNLQTILWLLSSIQEQIEQYQNEFKILANDYLNHNTELLNKITSILLERLEQNVDQLQDIKWQDPNIKLTTPTKQSAQIIQQTQQMLKTIIDVFIPQDMVTIIQQILKDLKTLYFEGLNCQSDIGEERLINEKTYAIQEICNFSWPEYVKSDIQQFKDQVLLIIQQKQIQN